MEHYSTSFCREFRCASSWHSHLIRSAIFGFFYQGTLKSLTNHKTYKIHAHKIQGVFFLRSPKRRRQLGHRHKGLGDAKTDEHSCKSFILVQQMTICHVNVDFWNHQICIRTYPMRGYLLTWYFMNPSARGYLLTWYFINLGIPWIFINVDIYYSSDLSMIKGSMKSYTAVDCRQRILKSYQAIYMLRTKYPEIIPGIYVPIGLLE